MRVHQLVQYLMTECAPNDVIFVNDKPAKSTLKGTGYVSVTEHTLEWSPETVEIQGNEYAVIRK